MDTNFNIKTRGMRREEEVQNNIPHPPEIWTRDDEVQKSANETAKIFKLVKDLQFDNETFENEYVPSKKGSYYVYINYKKHTGKEVFILSDPDLGPNAPTNKKLEFEGYVSITFLAALATDSVNWAEIQKFKENVEGTGDMEEEETTITTEKPTAPQQQQQQQQGGMQIEQPESKITEAEADFSDDWRDAWVIPTWTFPLSERNQQCWVPVRLPQGQLQFRCSGPLEGNLSYRDANGYKLAWFEVLHATWKRRSTPPTAKAARCARVQLSQGIQIVFSPYVTTRITITNLDKMIQSVEALNKKEQELVEAQLNKAEENLKKNKRTLSLAQKQQLKLDIAYFEKKKRETDWTVTRKDIAPDPTTGWFKLSTNPFKLYSTYISKTDWNLYMKSLADDVPNSDMNLVIRPLIPPDYAAWTPTYPAMTMAVQGIHEKFFNVLSDVNTRADIIEQSLYTCTGARAAALKDGHKLSHLRELAQKEHFRAEPDGSGVRFQGTVNYAKMATASNKRGEEHKQGPIMAGKSASQIAVDELGWWHNNEQDDIKKGPRNDNQLANYLYAAEWLHLRAYSWGGHLDTEDYQGLTSQMPLNLVLGTSETNSIMLRFERAWQNMIAFEHGLQKVLEGDAPQGKLWIRTNPTAPVQKSILGGDDPSTNAVWDGVDHIEVDHYDANAGEGERFKIEYMAMTEDMRKVSKKYRWLAHSIAYHINMSTPSLALGNPRPELFVKFYPFRRSFFHRAESSLDGLLFAELKRQAREKAVKIVEDKWAAVDSDKCEKKKKEILGKDYVAPGDKKNKTGIALRPKKEEQETQLGKRPPPTGNRASKTASQAKQSAEQTHKILATGGKEDLSESQSDIAEEKDNDNNTGSRGQVPVKKPVNETKEKAVKKPQTSSDKRKLEAQKQLEIQAFEEKEQQKNILKQQQARVALFQSASQDYEKLKQQMEESKKKGSLSTTDPNSNALGGRQQQQQQQQQFPGYNLVQHQFPQDMRSDYINHSNITASMARQRTQGIDAIRQGQQDYIGAATGSIRNDGQTDTAKNGKFIWDRVFGHGNWK